MRFLKFVTILTLGGILLGCERPTPSPPKPDELARLNLSNHVNSIRTASIRYEPRYCDEAADDPARRLCHADVMQDLGGADKKIGLSTFSCSVEMNDRCLFVGTVEGADAIAPLPAAACADSLHPRTTIEVPGLGAVQVSDYTARDTANEAWVSASFTLGDNDLRLTEAQATQALEYLIGRIGSTCRSYPIGKTRIFLYPAGVPAGESANWIAWLEDFGSRKIKFNRTLLKDERGNRFACLPGKEPGIGSDDGTRLPPVRQREIIGTWAETGFNLTMSLERVKGKVYKVHRSAYCSSGDLGQLLQTRPQGRYAVIGSAHGDYYEVTESGDLGVFERAGSVDVLPKHFALHPAPAPQ